MPNGGGDAIVKRMDSTDDADRMTAGEGVDSVTPTTCISGDVLRGVKTPCDCPAFGTTCTPRTPRGATMALAEGPCAAYYEYERSVPSDAAE